jgi:hypothetical protein
MKKIIRLTESDLTRLVRRVIKEQATQNNITDIKAKAKSFADEIKSGVSSFGYTEVEVLDTVLNRLSSALHTYGKALLVEVYKLLGITSMEEYLDDEFMAYSMTKDYVRKHSYDKVGKGIHDLLGGPKAQKIMSLAKSLDDYYRNRHSKP